MSSTALLRDPSIDTASDRLLVVAAPEVALDLLRIAILRSDDVLFVAASLSPEIRRFAARFAIDVAERPFVEDDLVGMAAVLVSLPELEPENRIVRSARRSGVPIHVVDRPIVSDFTLLELFQHASASTLSA